MLNGWRSRPNLRRSTYSALFGGERALDIVAARSYTSVHYRSSVTEIEPAELPSNRSFPAEIERHLKSV